MNGRAPAVLLTALGEQASRLRPEVLRYVAGPPEPGLVGVGEGVFEVAGSRFGVWNRLARPLVGPCLLVTAHERGVPFTIVNRPARGERGEAELHAERVFGFASGEQRFVDVLRLAGGPGLLRNTLGASGRVELLLRCEVTDQGHLRLRSERARLVLGRLRLPLPALLSVRAEVEDGYDAGRGRQTICATVRNPLLGTVLEYRGSFDYRHEAE